MVTGLQQRQGMPSFPAGVIAPQVASAQPPRLDLPPLTLHAAIASLAVGGAERIVLDWAAHASATHRVRVLVLRASSQEWPTPPGVEFVRCPQAMTHSTLAHEGARIARSGNPVVLCHLLNASEREALARGGALPIPVVHNAQAGWIESAAAMAHAPYLIAVSHAAREQLIAAGCARVSVVRHLPRANSPHPNARMLWRERWAIPHDAFVIGMIGGVKPQKAYPRALRILAHLHARRDAWLVILGGPTGRDGDEAWRALLAQTLRLGLDDRVRLPGFVVDAQRTLPAFDVLLNTSRYEGLSIATLEALTVGLPVVASAVGGQGEIDAEALTLVPADASGAHWADAIERTVLCLAAKPRWAGFPSPRVWTLMHLPPPKLHGDHTVFVTANLNAGGAQRSLVNLTCMLAQELSFEILVCGTSSARAFLDMLAGAGIAVAMTTPSRDAFDHAEALLRHFARGGLRNVVFWNVDPKVKLLIAKALEHVPLRLIDVSPGAYAFEEMEATAEFQTLIGYSAKDYYARLDRLVMKHRRDAPTRARTSWIPNGVPVVTGTTMSHERPIRRIVVSGRIAPTKFLLEIVDAMRIVWREIPDATLHVLGTAEARASDYARALEHEIGSELDHRVFMHGAAFDAPQRLVEFDLALVVGLHQGSPNAVLEAMAAALPVVANDSGGTREMVLDGGTGILLIDRKPATIAAGLLRVMRDPRSAQRMARAGRARVLDRYSMRSMARAYRRLLMG